tara:strand:+ start:666 stop:875 length:210 start_codon:yes stop_codon:yes gene_type:complete
MNKEGEINKELIKVLKEKIQLLEEQKENIQEIINAQREQLILSGVVKRKEIVNNDTTEQLIITDVGVPK